MESSSEKKQVVSTLAEVKYCDSKCEMFRCGKDAIVYRTNTAWCRWTEDDCEVSNCSYATCTKRRLLSKGVCGETIKRKTVEKRPEELGPNVKLKGKAMRKLGEKEIF
jgi:hypothetical protein